MVISTSKPKYYIRYHDEVMTAGEFARRFGISYDALRKRIIAGKDIAAPFEERPHKAPKAPRRHRYSLEELAVLYRRFQGDEEELQILADFACVSRREAVKIREEILEYMESNMGGKR